MKETSEGDALQIKAQVFIEKIIIHVLEEVFW